MRHIKLRHFYAAMKIISVFLVRGLAAFVLR